LGVRPFWICSGLEVCVKLHALDLKLNLTYNVGIFYTTYFTLIIYNYRSAIIYFFVNSKFWNFINCKMIGRNKVNRCRLTFVNMTKMDFFSLVFCSLQGSMYIHSTFIKIWNIIKLCMWLEKHIFRKKLFFSMYKNLLRKISNCFVKNSKQWSQLTWMNGV